MKKTLTMILVGAALLFLVHSELLSKRAEAASAVGTARQVVIAAIAISNISDLNFGTGVPGEPQKAVPAGAVDTLENGSFQVSGQPNTAYTIILPSSPVTMATGTGGANERISVHHFQSYPQSGANGMLDGNGKQTLLIGATRDALKPNQVPGNYMGTYTIAVVY